MNKSASPPDVKKRKRQPEEVRRRILQCAFRAFANYGFDGASTRSIAGDAKVSLSLLLYHFRSKEELWKAVMTDVHSRVAKRFPPANRSMSASQVLREYIRNTVKSFAEMPELHRLMTQEGHHLTDRLLWLSEMGLKEDFKRLRRLIVEGQREGEVRDIEPSRLRYAIIAIAAVPFSVAAEYKLLTRHNPFHPDEIEASIKIIDNLVFKESK